MCRRETSILDASSRTKGLATCAVRGEDGVAVIVAMLAMLLMMALGWALVLSTSSETLVAANFRDSGEAGYAADAALERSIADLSRERDWNVVLSGAVQSSFVDGAPGGVRSLADGSTIDLFQRQNLANCSKVSVCGEDELNRVTRARPWGANNPRWRLYAYGSLAAFSVDSPYYVVVMVADDGADNDDDPGKDGSAPCGSAEPVVDGDPPASSCNPGTGIIELRAEAFGPRGARKVIEMTIARTCTAEGGTASKLAICAEAQGYNIRMGQSAIRILSWREVT